MKNNVKFLIEKIFDCLDIQYREFPGSKGLLYFCTLSNEITFNLSVNKEGMIKLWRFVGIASFSKKGKLCEYYKAEFPVSIGLEVTADSDVSFYLEQQCDFHDNQKEKYIQKIIEEYTKLVTRFCSEKLIL